MARKMEDKSVDEMCRTIDKLKENIILVEANYVIEQTKVDSPYMTKLTSVSDKLNMIRSTVDALLTKIPQPQTRKHRGREGKERDSGLSSVDSAVLGSRDSSVLEGGNGLGSLVLEEKSVSTDNLHQQCPSCFQKVLNPLQETESPQNMPSGKEAADNTSSDDENI
ncbi:hypothetical protein KP79_PYT06474 [Mizuhopecten yessoensis]|uniref:Uncharacterized protein n=1 Tax=Mizuhopecten yessoensis TaxID=6573 RepID=A0A210QW08_MIZYE|nr:hypothetical protein KP79_PYT06474 [Mizuhopecten yessoensis]